MAASYRRAAGAGAARGRGRCPAFEQRQELGPEPPGRLLVDDQPAALDPAPPPSAEMPPDLGFMGDGGS